MQSLSVILRLPKQFAIIVAALLVLTAFAIISFNASSYKKVLIDSVQAESNSNSHRFAKALLDEYRAAAHERRFGDNHLHLDDEAILSLNEIAKQVLKSSTVVEIQAIDRFGFIIYSTDGRKIGRKAIDNEGVRKALTGKSHGELSTQEKIQMENGNLVTRDLVHSYLPESLPNTSGVLGVLRISTDVTATLNLFNSGQDRVTLFGLAIFFCLFLLILFFVRSAERTLRQQAVALEQSQALTFVKNVELEQEVAERQKAEERLRKFNDTLEQQARKRSAELQSAQEELVKQEKLATMGRLIANVSHELRNPLSTIENSVQLIEVMSEAQGIDLNRPVSRIYRGLQRSRGIIDELLDYTRSREPERSETEFDPWLRSVLDDYVRPHGITLEPDLSSDGATVSLAADQFRRVVVNLIDNAFQAIAQSQGEDTVRNGEVRIVSVLQNKHLLLRVIDKGPGIEPQHLQRIFEPFFTTKSSGVGLGLPMVRKIVEQHDGKIDVISSKGQGTEVRITLPLLKRKEEAA